MPTRERRQPDVAMRPDHMTDDKNTTSMVYKNCGSVVIPSQLIEFTDARFILIDKINGKGKKPKQRKWNTENNYSANEPILLGHIRGGGNYGIATGFGWLVCLDIDNIDRMDELGITQTLPDTLTVRTGRANGKGRHYWYEIEGLKKKITLYDQVLKEQDNENEYLHLGEIQTIGNYAIGPNSIHESGNRYEIINDTRIAKISEEQMLEIIKPLRTKKKEDKNKIETKTTTAENIKNRRHEVNIRKIGEPRGNVITREGKHGKELVGSHPFHGSKNGKNFSVSPRDGIWNCFRCNSGGGWVELLAVKENIIQCSQAGQKCLTKEQYRQVMRRAEELGLLEEQIIEAPIKEIQMDREIIEKIPTEIPEGDMILLVAPPRTGKTHTVINWLKKYGNGNYITHTHAIVEHAIKIAKEINMEGVVWVIGKKQPGACIHTESSEEECNKCPLKHGKDNHTDIVRNAKKLLKENKILTAEDIPKNFCPHAILKEAEKHAKYCFTVVNNINNIITRKMTILDEEPVLSYFYPPSIEIAMMKNKVGVSKNTNMISSSTQLSFEIDQILHHKKNKKMKPYAELLTTISNMIDITIEESAKGWQNSKDANEILEYCLTETLLKFAPTDEILDNGTMWEEGNELTLETCIKCLGKIYKETPVTITNRGNGYKSVYILGDERDAVYNLEWMEETEKVIIIGATKAELFCKQFGGRELRIEKFRYDERFLVVGVDEPDKSLPGNKLRVAQKNKIIDTAKEYWKNTETKTRSPFMILTGSKQEQEKVSNMIQGAIKISKEREQGMEWGWTQGAPAIIYQNSVISRGLDVDQYNLMMVYGCNFSQPFWHVADPGIESAIISDETTNSVLRISSTLRVDEKTLKIILMRKDDVHKVKFLSNIKITTQDARVIARTLETMNITGKVGIIHKKGIEIKSTGVDFKAGKCRFSELISGREDTFDAKECESVMSRIRALIVENEKTGSKTTGTNKIIEEVKTRSGQHMIRHALQELYSIGWLTFYQKGTRTFWSRKK